MNLRRKPTSPRRCAAAVATAAAALMLTPGTAFAAGHPAGPDRPTASESGDAAGHSADRPTHKPRHKNGHAASHTAGHTAGHKNGHSTAGHKTGHSGSGHKTGHPAAGHPTGHTVSHSPGHTLGHTVGHTVGSPKTGAHIARAAAPGTGTSPSADTSSDSGSSGSDNAGPDESGGTSTGKGGGTGQDSGTKKSPQSGPVATVIKLSMSKTPTATRPVTMSARVSPAHRSVGAPPETGTVIFTVDGASSSPLALTSNRVSVKVKLAAGKHTASAKYSGDSAHSPSESGPVSFTVN